jgi:DNA replication protein DnaC
MKYEDYNFGARYDDAHLSKLDLPPGTTNLLSNWVKNASNFLVFVGNPGVGKTYFCACLVKEILERKKIPYYFTERALQQKMRDSISKGWDYEETLKRICETEYVLLDDIGSSQLTDFQKEVLFNFVDYRSSSGLPTVITSNVWMSEMKDKFSPRFASRLKDVKNTIIEINWKDKRQE